MASSSISKSRSVTLPHSHLHLQYMVATMSQGDTSRICKPLAESILLTSRVIRGLHHILQEII